MITALTRDRVHQIRIAGKTDSYWSRLWGNQVRVGINAPKNVPVHREEIYERIKAEKEQNGG